MKTFIGRGVFPLLIVFLMVSAACIFSSTPAAPGSQGSAVPSLPAANDCLIGEWELNDFGDSITSMMPSGSSVQYQGTSGRMHWTFIAGGIVEAQADHFSLSFADPTDSSLNVTVTTNGLAMRAYTISGPGQLSFSDPDDSNFIYSATVDGVNVDLAPLLKGLVPVPPSQGVLGYQCQGNSLTITNPAAPQMMPLGFTKSNF
jgi:hypothetical protein